MPKTPDLDLNPWTPHPPDEDEDDDHRPAIPAASSSHHHTSASSTSHHATSPIPSEDPPTYSSSGATLPTRTHSSAPPGSANAPFPASGNPAVTITPALYTPPASSLTPDQTTLVTVSPALCTDADALVRFVRAQARLPPKPVVRVLGRHKSSDGRMHVDFDLSLSVMGLFVRSADGAEGQWGYLKVREGLVTAPGGSGGGEKSGGGRGAPAEGRPVDSLEEWARVFTKDGSASKTFALHRHPTNWSTEFLEAQLHYLLHQLKYRGEVTVTFPIHHRSVVVSNTPNPTLPPAPTLDASAARLTIAPAPGADTDNAEASHNPRKSKTKSFFAGVTANLFSSVTRLLPQPKHYDVVSAIWPYATLAATEDSGVNDSRREFAVKSEQAFWNEWRDGIRNAILGRRRGWVTQEDLLEVRMGFVVPDEKREWGVHAW